MSDATDDLRRVRYFCRGCSWYGAEPLPEWHCPTCGHAVIDVLEEPLATIQAAARLRTLAAAVRALPRTVWCVEPGRPCSLNRPRELWCPHCQLRAALEAAEVGDAQT